MMDIERFEDRAAWLEYCDGMSRFAAETEAARRQGLKRWEAIDEIRRRDSEGSGDQRQADARDAADDMPGMQRGTEEETRSVPERDVQAGRGGLELLALRTRRRSLP